jgi:hypothetical protein
MCERPVAAIRACKRLLRPAGWVEQRDARHDRISGITTCRAPQAEPKLQEYDLTQLQMTSEQDKQVFCPVPAGPDLSNLTVVELLPEDRLVDYRAAMQLANTEAEERLGQHMLLSWYDRDRDFESPQHASECHLDSAVPGYVDYGIYHGATLKVDIEHGRFVFFYLPVDLD